MNCFFCKKMMDDEGDYFSCIHENDIEIRSFDSYVSVRIHTNYEHILPTRLIQFTSGISMIRTHLNKPIFLEDYYINNHSYEELINKLKMFILFK
jgi:hypothetical protein